MITDLYDLENKGEEISRQLIKEIKYLAEAKGFLSIEKFNIKFKIEAISPYN